MKWAGLRGHAPIPPAEAVRRGAKMAAESGPDPELEELLESERGSGGGAGCGTGGCWGCLGAVGLCGASGYWGILGVWGRYGAWSY